MLAMKRRDFLRTAGSFVVVAGAGIGCDERPKMAGTGGAGGGAGAGGAGGTGGEAGMGGAGAGGMGGMPGLYGYPQGVASGDPREASIMLWTRVLPTSGAGTVRVRAEVSKTQDFQAIVAMREMSVGSDSDHTLRLLVEGLDADTLYYYRFTAGADVSTVGRTRTAPAAAADRTVRLAWASCQDRGPGFYSAWRKMLTDDLAAPADQQLDFVVFLGDFIYETVGAKFQLGIDESFQPMPLVDRGGQPRSPDPLPDGADTPNDTGKHAVTLADYRHLYKQYLRDPHLQAARARWPFVCIWDDHEFTNDCWQTQANYISNSSNDEPAQKRKVASNQAWFEYVPAQLTGASGVTGVAQHAKDFASASVTDAMYGATQVDADNEVTEPNNVSALATLTIFRSFRFGKHLELVLTDERSYRSDHAIPEDVSFGSPFFFDPRNAVPYEMTVAMDQGRTAGGGNPPATFYGFYDNTRKMSPPGTMLGPTQKQWWKDTIKGSTATWKVWGNEVTLLRMLADTGKTGLLEWDLLVSQDAWDGYGTERGELMKYLTDNAIRNVVSISGDLHAHFAGYVLDNHDAATGKKVMIDLLAAGISSGTFFSFFESATRGTAVPAELRRLITYDSTTQGGNQKFVENFNMVLAWGVKSATTAAMTNSIDMAMAQRVATHNAHLAYVDSNAHGYGLLTIEAAQITAKLVTIAPPITDLGDMSPAPLRVASFTIPLQGPTDPPRLIGPEITGTKPFPLR